MSLRTGWKSLSHFQRHVLINIALGLLIEGALELFHHSPAVQRAENAGIDLAIRFFGTRSGTDDPEAGLGYTILDIDDASWAAWGEPNVTPRDRILTLLRHASGAGAAAVLVDLDLTGREGDNGLAPSPEDRKLSDFLTRYRGPTPIVLARTLRPPAAEDSAHPLPAPVRAWFEAPDSPQPPVYWGTVQFVEEVDGVVRRWRLWEPVCDHGTARVLPSIQLMAAAVLDSASSPELLAASLREMAPPVCRPGLAPVPFTVFGHHLKPKEHAEPERVIFSLAWPPEGSTRTVRLANGNVVPVLLRISAAQAADTGAPVDRGLLEGRVVVIGNSSGAGRDWYVTPLGRMPGMLVVINAVESLRAKGQSGDRRTPLKWVVFVVLLLVASVAYARFVPLVATLIVIPLIYVAVLPISFYLFNSGVWLDFMVPVLGVQLHELIASAETAWAQRGRRLGAHH